MFLVRGFHKRKCLEDASKEKQFRLLYADAKGIDMEGRTYREIKFDAAELHMKLGAPCEWFNPEIGLWVTFRFRDGGYRFWIEGQAEHEFIPWMPEVDLVGSKGHWRGKWRVDSEKIVHDLESFPGGAPADWGYHWCVRCGALRVTMDLAGVEWFAPGIQYNRTKFGLVGQNEIPACGDVVSKMFGAARRPDVTDT
jgi:hypothetical protein